MLHGPHYAAWGVVALLQLDTGTYDDLVMIDMTAGVSLPGPIDIQTVRPAALVLAGELDDRGILPSQLDGGSLALNGKSWKIIAHQMKPSPNGDLDGEIALLLEKA